MAVIATSNGTFGELVKWQPNIDYCNEVVTANEASATTYVLGTILGIVTSTGKYKVCTRTAVDGSQVPAAVVFNPTLAISATTDTKVKTVRRLSCLNKGALVLDASFSTQAHKDALYAQLLSIGLVTYEQV